MVKIRSIISLYNEYQEQNRLLKLSFASKVQGHVLMFHNISDDDIDSPLSCKCKVAEFEKILVEYENNGFAFVDIDTAIVYLKENSERKFAVITFDDIPENVFTNAYPILKRNRIPFTIFICVGFIDKPGFITKEQLTQLSLDSLCTIGAHTMTHVNLSKNDDGAWEIAQSKNVLEEIIEKPIRFFAYPYGSKSAVPSDACEAAKKAGYILAFSAVPAPLSYDSFLENRWFLPRVVAREGKVVSFNNKSIFKTLVRKIFNNMISNHTS